MTGKHGTQLVADSRLAHEHVRELMIELQGIDLDEAEFEGVLSTSNRKPPLRIPLRRVAEILTHPGQVEVVSPKRVDVFAHERSDVAQRFVSNLVALGT